MVLQTLIFKLLFRVNRLDIKRENIKRQNLPGNHFGLSVLLDADVEDYCFPIRNAQGFDVSTILFISYY